MKRPAEALATPQGWPDHNDSLGDIVMATNNLPHDTFLPISAVAANVVAQVPLPPPRYPHVAYALARYRARKAVEAELRSQGIRVQYVPMAIIREQAQAYLEEHREELLQQCAEIVQRDPKLREMAEQEERQRERQRRKLRKSGLLDHAERNSR